MKQQLLHLLDKYGFDFFHKLSRYKTAKHTASGLYVQLLEFHPTNLTFKVSDERKEMFLCCIFDLDDFVL